MLELYTHPMSPCAQKVRLVLAEKGLEWQAHFVDLKNKANLQPEYLKLNPLGVVPTLVHDGRPVIESSLICEYLDEVFPDTALRPEEPYLRAQMRLWFKHVDNRLHPSCGALQWPMVMREGLLALSEEEQNRIIDRVPEQPRRERQRRLLKLGLDAPDVVGAVAVYRRTIVDMEAALEDRPWLMGESFTLADIALAPYFQTLHQFAWTDMYADCPRVADWYQRCRERQSYETAVSGDFASDVLASLHESGLRAWPKIQQHLGNT